MAIAQEMHSKKTVWQSVLLLTLAFWLSSSVLLDMVIMPILYTSGMMVEPGFAIAGYSMFWVFNRIELLCAALVLTSTLVLNRAKPDTATPRSVLLAGALLLLVLVCTYGLAPQMSGLGLQLNLFTPQTAPVLMNSLHAGYWVLELVKLSIGGYLVASQWKNVAEAF